MIKLKLKAEESVDKWIYKPNPNDSAQVRLVCFPYAGASAEVFHTWAAGLPDSWEFCGIQLPGRSTRLKERPVKKLDRLLDRLEPVIKSLMDKPCIFLGHSMGTLISFELTKRLHAGNEKLPVMLIASARKAAHIPLGRKPYHTLSYKKGIEMLKKQNPVIPEYILNDDALMKRFLLITKADFEMIEKWPVDENSPDIPVPILTMRGESDNLEIPENIEAWEDLTSDKFRIKAFPGGHFYLLEKQNSETTINEIISAVESWNLI